MFHRGSAVSSSDATAKANHLFNIVKFMRSWHWCRHGPVFSSSLNTDPDHYRYGPLPPVRHPQTGQPGSFQVQADLLEQEQTVAILP